MLTRLLNRASQQDAWTDQLRALLPQDVALHCRVANVRDQVLTVHINNAAWATRLRFLIPALLQPLNRLGDFVHVTEVRLKVVSVGAEVQPAATNTQTVRPPDSAQLVELANSVDHVHLRSAILRLAAHADLTSSTSEDRSGSAEYRSGE